MKTTSFIAFLCAGALVATTACNTENQSAGTDAANTTAAASNDPTAIDTNPLTPGEATAHNSALNGSTLDDQQFMIKADQGGHNEIGLSQLALEKGVTGDTKTFADKMIADHTKAGNELKAIAQQKGVTLTGEMDAEHKSLRDAMSKMSGKQFEQAYMDQMVKDHEQTVALLENEIDGGKDADVKAWAQKTLPVVQQHDVMAKHDSNMKM